MIKSFESPSRNQRKGTMLSFLFEKKLIDKQLQLRSTEYGHGKVPERLDNFVSCKKISKVHHCDKQNLNGKRSLHYKS